MLVVCPEPVFPVLEEEEEEEPTALARTFAIPRPKADL
jgi:hypothetical protein